MDGLTIWTIYCYQLDYPTKWVLRPVTVGGGGNLLAGEAITGDSLEAVRAHLPPGLVRYDH